MVMTMAGPIKPRMVQRRHSQRVRLLIDVHPPKSCCLRTAAETVAKHQYADGNQNQGPEAFDLIKGKPIEIIEKKECAEYDENYRSDGAILAPGFKGIGGRFTAFLGLSRAHAVERHVKDKTGQQNPEHRFHPTIQVARKTEHERRKHDNMN